MTQFDLIVLILLLISAAFGFARGAVAEIAALTALVAAAALAILTLPISAPVMHKAVHSEWLAAGGALILVFGAVYLILRLVFGAAARQIQETRFLGVLDRSLGLLIGLARGLLVLGALNLAFNAATPEELRPEWIVGSKTWPLSQNMGRALKAMAPKGLDIAGRLKPTFDQAIHAAARKALDDRLKSDGYDARQRGEIDDLVEKSR
ncbi:MAG TPA: CvpA family protein [Phenylobacterium sp.]|nr:CvpA family protein [Phenylobacterium sp.]